MTNILNDNSIKFPFEHLLNNFCGRRRCGGARQHGYHHAGPPPRRRRPQKLKIRGGLGVWTDVRFELDVTSVSNSTGRPFRTQSDTLDKYYFR